MLFNKLEHVPSWQRNLFILWIGVFMMGIGFSEVMPFLPLYVDTLGHFTQDQLTFYSSLTFSTTFFTMAIFSPFWGKLADSKGRKLMLMRASLGMAIIFILMGLVTNVWQLIFLRALQGIFGGFISNANAMVATQVPKERSGYALGFLVTGATAGQLLGPFLGGTIASFVSYRTCFYITGIIFGAVFLLTTLFVHERFTPVKKEDSPSFKTVINLLPNARLTFGLCLTMLIIQTANMSIGPIISLVVRTLDHGSLSTTFLAGVVAAMPGIATLIAAPRFGIIGDRIGTDRMIMIGFGIALLSLVPSAFVIAVWQLAVLRLIMGVSNATMLPAVQTLLAKTTPSQITSRVFAYGQSFQSIGSVVGPMLGSLVASQFGYSGIFIASALLVALNALFFWSNTKSLRTS